MFASHPSTGADCTCFSVPVAVLRGLALAELLCQWMPLWHLLAALAGQMLPIFGESPRDLPAFCPWKCQVWGCQRV